MSILRIVAIAAMLPAGVANAQATTYYGDGYSIVIPEGWTEMPREVLEAVHQLTNVEYTAGFANPDGDGWTDSPYVLVQEFAFPEEYTPITKTEAVVAVKAIAGMDVDTVIRESEIPLDAMERLSLSEIDAGLQWDRRQLWIRTLGTWDDDAVRHEVIWHFDSTRVVAVNFYALADDWPASEAARFHNGFAFDTPIPDMIPVSVANAQPTTYYGDGYSIVLPEGWTEIPAEVLEALHELTTFKYTAGFANPDGDEWFDLPYVLVNEIEYPEEYIPITKTGAIEVVRTIAGIDVAEVIRETEAPMLDYVDVAVGETDVSLQWDRRQYCQRGLMTVDDTVVRGRSIGHFGFNKIVSVNFYALADEWPVNEVARFHSRFAFDTPIPDIAGRPGKRSSDRWERVAAKGAIGVVAAVLFAVFGFISLKSRRSPGSHMGIARSSETRSTN